MRLAAASVCCPTPVPRWPEESVVWCVVGGSTRTGGCKRSCRDAAHAATAAQEAAGLWHMDTPSLHSDGCPHHVAANFSDGLSGLSSPIGPTWVILAADTLVPHRWLLVAGARQQHPSSTGSPCSPGRLPAPSAWQVSCPAVAWCIRELSLVLRGPIRPAPISRPSAAGRVCELVCELQVNDVTNEPELTRVG